MDAYVLADNKYRLIEVITLFLAIAPVFAIIILGYGLRLGGIQSIELWNFNDTLVYWLLLLALIFAKIYTADLTVDLSD